MAQMVRGHGHHARSPSRPTSSLEAYLPTRTLKTLGSSSVTWQNSAYSPPPQQLLRDLEDHSLLWKRPSGPFLSRVPTHKQHENKDPENGWGKSGLIHPLCAMHSLCQGGRVSMLSICFHKIVLCSPGLTDCLNEHSSLGRKLPSCLFQAGCLLRSSRCACSSHQGGLFEPQGQGKESLRNKSCVGRHPGSA